ncbi:MAG: DUF6067 family protein [Planctomycetia bacterium]|nr:DUF6067 family protein [Planctomycetia bacterium]
MMRALPLVTCLVLLGVFPQDAAAAEPATTPQKSKGIAVAAAEKAAYGLGSWSDTLGAHRARVRVAEKADAVRVHIPWRRRDLQPEKKRIIVMDAATGNRVANVAAVDLRREYGDLVFQPPTAPGEYDVYYLPHVVQPGSGGYGDGYLPPEATAEAAWLARHSLAAEQLSQGVWKQLPEATVVEIQARDEFERFDPMEVIATAEETRQLVAACPEPYLVFPEDRKYPIRMTRDLPLRWIENGPAAEFHGTADRNEYYAFQVGLYAARGPVEDVAVEFGDLRADGGGVIPAAAMTCFNLGGIDWLGRPFRKVVNVPAGRVQALWFGVDVPRDAAPGEYRGSLTIQPKGGPATRVHLTLTVNDQILEDRGDGEPWRHSRLRWLNSTIGIDDEVVRPYTPLEVDSRTVGCLGRAVEFADTGLPAKIRCGTREVLAGPMTLVAQIADAKYPLSAARSELAKRGPGAVVIESEGKAGPLVVSSHATIEFDGHLDFTLSVKADQPTDLSDLCLEIPVRREAATYLMGIGRPGGLRPKDWSWKWGGKVYYDSFWIGDAHAGLQCELRGTSYSGPMVNLYWPLGQLQPPEAWHNGGFGGCSITETAGGDVLVRAYCGPRRLEKDQTLRLEFALLVTPVKPLDPAAHFRARYYHSCEPVDRAIGIGANVINIHHANELNPFINYPFLATDKLSAYVREAHAKGAKVKIYYTVRELTNRVTEIAALRSLGNEVFAPGSGGGYPWLQEHLDPDHTPAWYDRLPNGDVSAAMVTSGASRWYNYYLEGLNWLVRNVEIDGLYLDDVTYDREILKRMRKIMERARPGCLIDLHSNTLFSHGPANQYLEFFPYIDRLWFGEGFNYDDPPDFWLTEVSGIPYGLMGEMLQDGGNKWRGMLYGMTARMPWRDDVKPLWRLWDEFGIADARMIGYWEKDCPVRAEGPGVLATVYTRPGKALVSLASWAGAPAVCRLKIDWQALGMDPAKTTITAPAVENFQESRRFGPDEPIPVEPGRGWLLILAPAQ